MHILCITEQSHYSTASYIYAYFTAKTAVKPGLPYRICTLLFQVRMQSVQAWEWNTVESYFIPQEVNITHLELLTCTTYLTMSHEYQ